MRYIKLITLLAVACFFLSSCDEAPSPLVVSVASVQNVGSGQSDVVLDQDESEIENWPFNIEADIPKEYKDGSLSDNELGKNYLVVFDGSGSMDGTDCSNGTKKIDAAKVAVNEWSKSLPSDANVGLVAFHNGGWVILPINENEDRSEFFGAVNSLVQGGGTPLSAAFQAAYHLLSAQGLRQLGYGEYTLVAVTDGAAADAFGLDKWVNFIYDKTSIQISTIGFCIGESHTLNQPDKVYYTAADNPEELRAGLDSVSAESETFDVSDFN